MGKEQLVENISARANISKTQAELVLNEVVTGIVAPHIFDKGELAGIFDNQCTNNCKQPTSDVSTSVTPINR